MKKIIFTPEAPEPIGPYSQAILIDKTLYTSGQIAIDPNTGDLKIENIDEETHLVMQHLHSILKIANMNFSHVVKCSIFLKDMNQFAAVNQVYGSYFKDFPPARETVQVAKLPKGVNVEISAIAVLA